MPNPLRRDDARFPHETMEGETVLIDADRGHLFLLTGLGPWIWSRFASASDRDAVVAEIAARFGDEASAACGTFIDSMRDLELLIETSGTNDAEPATDEIAPPWPTAYEPPTLETFEDVSEIIRMDPIHEVDADSGWPNPPRA